MLTFDTFKTYPDGEIFNSGVLPNSPDGLFMTRSGGELRWVATKGYGNDWTIYCHWSDKSEEWIKLHGDKVHSEDHIKKCVICDDEMLKRYRY